MIAAAILLAGCGADAALDALPAGGRGRVTEIQAGDSLILAPGGLVRLAGVEAPKGEEPYAVEARAALARLALGHEIELLQGGERQDARGRILAQARETGRRTWLQGALLRQGAARVRTYPDNRALARAMLEEEAKARTARRGLWALPAYQVRLPQEVGPDQRGFVVVEGRVRRLWRDRGRVVLAFEDRSVGFAAEIPFVAQDDFSAGGMEPATLAGRLIRVRGVVSPTPEGPRLWLDHPEQVEPLAGS
ncbi:MAG TPA: thermonuclease family protein [Caulobacteraceae bacterium]|jgi:endonuclease YncB( thermonuclease family)|nr:thermonuclease family protein [Caulobacteraceae bacterium]